MIYMINVLVSLKNLILDLLFPPQCINCGREGDYLCQDCQSLIEIMENLYCPVCSKSLPSFNHYTTISDVGGLKKDALESFPKRKKINGVCPACKNKTALNGLFFAADYQNPIVKKMISRFKYKPWIKELAKPLANLILLHFQLTNQLFRGYVLIPIPLYKKRLKERGFNQSAVISRELSKNLNLPVFEDFLIKIKSTPSQTELNKEKRGENVKETFLVKNAGEIKNKKILLADDVFTTGATMEECAKVLKEAGAKEIWGVTIARE